MCGISGYIGPRDAVLVILEGLAKLEYRGYDSAGIAVFAADHLRVYKTRGLVNNLAAIVPPLDQCHMGIGHTRWATHGEPSFANAHPHMDAQQRIAIVHNGIIENAANLRNRLESEGVLFASETDTEVLAHLIAIADAPSLEESVMRALRSVEGTYGLAVVDTRDASKIVLAQSGSPVAIGVGDGEHFIGSDVAAFARYTQRAVYLEDGELAVVTRDAVRTIGLNAAPHKKRITTFSWDQTAHEKGGFAHFMQKEVHDQPGSVARTLAGRLGQLDKAAQLDGLDLTLNELAQVRRIKLLGCGSAYYSGLSGAHVIETLARIPADAEPSSEFRYRNPVIDPSTFYIAISQSGETLDTLRAVQDIVAQGGNVLGVVNVVGSSIARACTSNFYLHAGPEISVASTKSFTSTLVALVLLALKFGQARSLDDEDVVRVTKGLDQLPSVIEETLELESHVAAIATSFSCVRSAFFLGRVAGFPIALEGSQKLKEVAYVHAEAYPAAELKHGPLALVTSDLPSFAVVPSDSLFSKNMTTLEEVHARGGPVITIGHSEDKRIADEVIIVPKTENEIDPIILTLPLQMLAYHMAVALEIDVDRPRNLAKSVTVE